MFKKPDSKENGIKDIFLKVVFKKFKSDLTKSIYLFKCFFIKDQVSKINEITGGLLRTIIITGLKA